MSLTHQSLTILLATFFLTFGIAPAIIWLLYKFKIVRKIDKDFSAIIDSRRLKAGTPIMGGLMIVIAVTTVTFLANFDGSIKIPLLVFTMSGLLGAFDDVLNIYGRERPVRSIRRTLTLIQVHHNWTTRIYLALLLPWQIYKRFFYFLGSNPGKGIQVHEKIIVQIIAGALVGWWIYYKLGWTEVWIPFDGTINIGWLMFPFVIFTVISMANAVNISDGMDGLGTGMLLTSFFAYLVLAIQAGDSSMALLNATVIGALLAYLYFNIKPARVQMGDVGTLALGALLATVAFAQQRPLLLLVIASPFILEIGSTVVQGMARRITGRRIFKMAPIHYHFEMLGWSEEKVVMRFWLFSIVVAIVGVWLAGF